jgi:hypothetical protein
MFAKATDGIDAMGGSFTMPCITVAVTSDAA